MHRVSAMLGHFAYISMCHIRLYTLANTDLFPVAHRSRSAKYMHTSAYVSIRQHTSAYVSIRQHTSACAAYFCIYKYTDIHTHTHAHAHKHTHTYIHLIQSMSFTAISDTTILLTAISDTSVDFQIDTCFRLGIVYY
jgi:hypothetical protein